MARTINRNTDIWIIVDRPQGRPLPSAQQADPYLAMRMLGQLVDFLVDAT